MNASKLSDVIQTPEPIAKEIVDYFKPSGVCLDPCRGLGAFWKQMPGAEWCEITEGRDFFDWQKPVDWIITNPPFSILDEWLEHSYKIARNFVYLLPLPKLFNSARRLQRISELGAIREVLVVTAGRKLGFPFGYACGAIHFETGYNGACKMTPMRSTPNIAALVERIEGSINEWRGLAHEAFKRGDEVGVWEAGQQIKDLERKRDSMRKPSAA